MASSWVVAEGLFDLPGTESQVLGPLIENPGGFRMQIVFSRDNDKKMHF